MLAKALYNLELLIDSIVAYVAQLHPAVRRVSRPVLYPFVYWRLKNVAQMLKNDCGWLPSVPWTDVEKHGENVVYYKRERFDVTTKKYVEDGMMVVDYKHHTVRTVTGLPEKHKKPGATF